MLLAGDTPGLDRENFVISDGNFQADS